MPPIIDLNGKISSEDYEDKLYRYQTDLKMMQLFLHEKKTPLIIVVEGLETSGKGKAIQEITRPFDPRLFKVFPIFMATEDEKEYPFLYRFWMNTPSKGRIHIFNRSWYIRLLDARIRKNISKEDWYTALRETREFEKTLIDNGTHLIKIWMKISEKEQHKRLKKRESRPDLKFRVTKEVWDDHKKYDKYQDLLKETLMHTDTNNSPWYVIDSDNKKTARVEILRTIIDRMGKQVGTDFLEKAKKARDQKLARMAEK